MQRFLLTCAISLGLLAALQLYTQVMAPLTRAVEQPKRPARSSPGEKPSGIVSTVAQSWLPDEEWLKTAVIEWKRSDQSFMYARTVTAAEKPTLESGDAVSGDTIRMEPFAMIWKDERHPNDPPLTIVAASARVTFENQFFDQGQLADNSINLSGGDAGRVVSAALEGQVRVTGPDGLVISGQDFIFVEENAQLYSDRAVNFRYGPPRQGKPVQVRGTSAGLVIDFTPAPHSPLGNDMPRIEQLPQSVQLRGRVAIDFISEDAGQPTKTRVTSEGPFQYDFEHHTATFSEKVLVSRPRGKHHRDEIECSLLAMIFGEAPKSRDSNAQDIVPANATQLDEVDQPQDNQPGLLSRMELKSVWARTTQKPGSVTREQVILRSSENGLTCSLDDLAYDVSKQLFTLTDRKQVQVVRELDGQVHKFDAPKIEIRHSDDQRLQQLSGVGAGSFSHRLDAQSVGRPDLLAYWKDRMDLIPNQQEQETTLTLRGTATVEQLDQMQFSGQTLTAWLPPLEDLSAGVVTTGSRPRPVTRKVAPDQVPIRRIQAIGNVTFIAPGVVGRRIDQVNIQIVPGQIIPLNQPDRSRDTDVDGNEAEDDSLVAGEPVVFECARIDGIAVFDAATQRADIRELHGTDGVQVFRASPESEGGELPFEQQPFRMTAHEFDVTNEGGTRQILTLRGVVDEQGHIREPVIAKIGDYAMEGPRIVFDRAKNLVTVEIDRNKLVKGPAVLRFPVNRDFSGQPLNPPAIANIACVEKIMFDGQNATFLQSVKATVLANVIKAEELTVTLNGRLDFSADRPETSNLAIQTIRCRDKVSVEMYQRDPKNIQLIEILVATLQQFVIEPESGKFEGQGPGKFEDWRRTGTRRMLVQSRGTAQANRPADTNRDYEWEYVGVDFKGQLEGNTQDRWGKLHREVKLMYAPVKNAHQVFKHDDLSSEAPNSANAVWVGSDTLTVGFAGDRISGQQPSVFIEAHGNAAMEGRLFYAQANSLHYEQAKEMFTLRGKGQDNATVNVQPYPGGPFSPLKARTIELHPSKQKVSVDGATTFTTAFGGQ